MVKFFLLMITTISMAQDDISKTLINGKAADLKLFPASVYANSGGGSCSATVVGEEVLLIAAHCVKHGASVSFSIGANRYSGVCSQAPLYRRNVDHDLALCKLNTKVSGVPFEWVNTDADLVKVGDEVLLTGYGCIRPGGGGGNDGIYRIGTSIVQRLPAPNNRNWDYVTSSGGALCFGDSGGPAFYYISDDKRKVVSVNSKGDIQRTSYLTSTTTKDSANFIKEWSDANKVKICGVHEDATGCRTNGEKIAPPEDDAHPLCRDLEQSMETWTSCLQDSKPSLELCDRANDTLQRCFSTK
jgi:hypothetical protein